jgi:hypothetical protein
LAHHLGKGFIPIRKPGKLPWKTASESYELEYGKDTIQLLSGDSIYYDSIVPHQVRGGSPSPARILAVVYAPL